MRFLFLSFIFLISLSVNSLGQVQFKTNDKVIKLKVELVDSQKNSPSFNLRLRELKEKVRVEFRGKNLKKGEYTLYRVLGCNGADFTIDEEKKILNFKTSTKSYLTEKSIDGSLNPKKQNYIGSFYVALIRYTPSKLHKIGCASFKDKLGF